MDRIWDGCCSLVPIECRCCPRAPVPVLRVILELRQGEGVAVVSEFVL